MRADSAHTNPNSDLMTAIVVARTSGLSRSTVDRAIHSGELPARKRGKLLLVKRKDYEHWIDNMGEPVAVAS